MKKLLNTLYVTSQGAYLSRDGETVLIKVDDSVRMRIPIHTLDGIVCFGRVFCTAPLMHLCSRNNVTVTFLNEYGRFWAKVQGPVSGNVLLRRQQYRIADCKEESARIARTIVIAKIANSRVALLRSIRDHKSKIDYDLIKNVVLKMMKIMETLKTERDLDFIRGKEGEAARLYYSVFDNMIVSQKDEFFFTERSRRPPMDNMNALMSFLYTIVTHDIVSALETVGLDPAVGYLHKERPGRPSLALDLVEEMRPYLADRIALSLINRQQIKGKGFAKSESGAIMMDDETRKEVLSAFQRRKQEEISHPFLGEKITIGLLPYVQSLLFARSIRGDIDGYPPFLWR